MKIAFVIKELKENAGQTNTIAQLIYYINKQFPDWQISILCHKNYSIPKLILNHKNINIIVIPSYYRTIFQRKKLKKVLMTYDFIYDKSTFPYFFTIRRSGIPYALVVHQLDSLKLFSDYRSKIQTLGTMILTKFIVKRSNLVITVTPELGKFYEQNYGIKVIVIPDSIPEKFYAGNRSNKPNMNNLKLLSVGYWDGPKGRKRQHLLISMLKELKDKKIKTTLTLAGLDQSNINALTNVVNYYEVQDSVNLIGHLDEKDLVHQYSVNDVYVTATTYEGFYRQVIESFACGMPALVYDSRIVTKELSQSASVLHIMKSNGGGELYSTTNSFINQLKKIVNNYENYSKKAFEYSLLFKEELSGSLTVDIIKEATLKDRCKREE